MPHQGTCSLTGCTKKLKKSGSRGGKCAMHLARFRIYGSYEIPEKVNTCKGGCGAELRRPPGVTTGYVPVWCPECKRRNFNAVRVASRAASRAAILGKPVRCARCPVEFYRKRLSGTPQTHCDECAKSRDYETVRRWIAENPERYAEMSRKWSRTRRVAVLQVERESYGHLEIFERDGWVCQLCFDEVDPALAWPNRMSATLDHKIPITLNGPDIRLNAQLAHYSCNSSKANRVDPTELDRLWAELAAARAEQELQELALAVS